MIEQNGGPQTAELCGLTLSAFLLGSAGISWFSPHFEAVSPFPSVGNVGRDDGQIIFLVSADNMNRAVGFSLRDFCISSWFDPCCGNDGMWITRTAYRPAK